MTYDTPFSLLDQGAVQLLSDPQHDYLKMIYIDCLAMLHDVLSDYRPRPQHSVFANLGQSIDQETIRSHAADLQRDAGVVLENVLFNTEIAFDLRQEAISPTRVTGDEACHFVDKYLDTLLNQYKILQESN